MVIHTALVACWEHAEYVTSLAEPVMRLLDRADRDQRKVVIARGSRMIASSNKGLLGGEKEGFSTYLMFLAS